MVEQYKDGGLYKINGPGDIRVDDSRQQQLLILWTISRKSQKNQIKILHQEMFRARSKNPPEPTSNLTAGGLHVIG